MQNLKQTALVGALMLSVATFSHAASLGQLTVISQAAENFQATFLVHDVQPKGTHLTARIAPAEVYAEHGLVMPETVKALLLSLVSKSPFTLKVSSKMPAKERAFALLVELNEGGQKTLRRYNIHLGATGSVQPMAMVTVPEVRTTTATPAIVTSEEKPADPIAQAVSANRAATTAQTPLERMRAHNYDLSQPLTVEAGYTPWSLGVLYQKLYPQASVPQVLVALALQNPQAFPHDNVRDLKTGASITAPSDQLVTSIDRKAAQQIVQKGLSISKVAATPAPIAQSAQPAPKPETVTKPIVKPVAPVVSTPAPKAEVPKVATTEPVAPVVQAPVADTPVPEAAATPQAPIVETAPETPEVAPTEVAAPNLEILSEEEIVPQDEGASGWLWALLGLLLAGGAGGAWIWYKRHQGAVNFEAFKSAFGQAKGSGQDVRAEPVVESTIQTVNIPAASTVVSVEKREESMAFGEQLSLEEAVIAPAQPQQDHTEAATVSDEPAPKPFISPNDLHLKASHATNVFDLVNDTEGEDMAPHPVAGGHSMSDALDMAKSFISIGAKLEAFELLQQVVKDGSSVERAKAEEMMDQIRGK